MKIFIRLSGILFFVVLLLLLFFTLTPRPGGFTHLTIRDFQFRIDYILHFSAFFTLSLFFLFWKSLYYVKKQYVILIPYFFIGLGLALLLEFLQKFIPGRTFNPFDFIANACGILGAFCTFIPVYHAILQKLLK